MAEKNDKHHRASASQYFVAGELCRRGYVAAITTGNCPNTDILCSNKDGTRFVHIQVKTFNPEYRECSVGKKAERDCGENFFWVLGGIPTPESEKPFCYYIIPSAVMAKEIRRNHQKWLETPGKEGQDHRPTDVRMLPLPPKECRTGWSIEEYRNRWDVIEAKLT